MASPLELQSGSKFIDEEHRNEEENFSCAMQLVLSSVLSMSLHTAIELGVFDIIAKAGEGAELSPAEIAAELSTNNPEAPAMLDHILRMLASHSVLNCTVVGESNSESNKFQRLYSLGPVAKYFVTNEDGVSFGNLMALAQDKISLESWSQLKDAILEGGIPFNRAHGVHAFEYLGKDQRYNKVFNKAMYSNSTITVKNILKRYTGFSNLKQLVDVGGGVGATLNLITSKYPHVKGINFDLPHVIAHAPSFPGVEHVGGNMFDKVPTGDAILLKLVLHDWSDEHCLKILSNCYKALPDDGKVIILDTVFPVKPETSNAAKGTSLVDVLMMTQHVGGKERSHEEFQALATNAGFSAIKFECFVCNFWVMELFK